MNKTGWKIALIIFYFIISARYFYNPIFKQSENLPALLKASEAARAQTRPEDKLIIAAHYDPAVLVYYADRPTMVLALDNIGLPLAPYLRDVRFSKQDPEEIRGLELAMKDPVAWLEYLRTKGGQYLIAPDKKEIQNSLLLAYLETHYLKLSKPQDKFYLFSLKNQ